MPGRHGSLRQGLGEPLKGPTHKILFAATCPGLWQSALEMHEENLGLMALGSELKEQLQNACAEPSPLLQRPPFSDKALPSKWHQPEGNQ